MATMGSFWGQGLHLQSFSFDFPVNMLRYGALQHASRVGGYVKIITIDIDIHFENTFGIIENSINSEGRSLQCTFNKNKRYMMRNTAVSLDAYVNVIRE